LTGSNPLDEGAMDFLRKDGLIVYIDVDKNEILKRCHKMKIDRVVGMSSKTFSEILDYRREIYEKYYDYRVIVGNNDSVEDITNNIIKVLERDENFLNTRDSNSIKYFDDVVQHDDILSGQIFMPSYFPFFTASQIERLISMNKTER
jgi:hypothetical protein